MQSSRGFHWGVDIWLDWEAGTLDTVRRLIALGVSEDLLDRFHYSYSPNVPADESGFANLRYWVEESERPLVVFDSASKALSLAGLDENVPSEVTQWTTQVVMPLRGLDATVLVIDHVPKGATSQTAYARGAGSKLADTEVAWYVEATEPFSTSAIGELKLTRQKDRDGVLPLEVNLRIGNGRGGLPTSPA